MLERDPMLDFLARALSDFRDAGGRTEMMAECIKACFDEWHAARTAALTERIDMLSRNLSAMNDRQNGFIP